MIKNRRLLEQFVMEFIEFGKCLEFHGRKLRKQVAGRYGVLTPLSVDDVPQYDKHRLVALRL
jgi:hypothetical protein